jgi:hypothetical protein
MNINKNSSKQLDKYAIEYLKCRKNPLYFIYNYVKIPEIGGDILLSKDVLHPKMKRAIKSLVRYNRCIVMASRQLGKALDLDTLIPTPSGYAPIGDLEIGNYVFNGYHKLTKIIDTSEILLNRDCYKIYFSNGEEIIADGNHLWPIPNNINKTTYELYSYYKNNYPFIYFNYNKFKIESIEKVKSRPVKCITVENPDGIFLCGKTNIPTHNSTTAAAILTWAANFYSMMPIIILNMNKGSSLENLERIKFIHSNLPSWLKSPLKSKAERKTYLELDNKSIIRVFSPSSTASPNQIARSLTSPILYIDEVAHIRHISIAYRAAQPVLSKAREQAARHGYPTFVLLTSTPNGVAGEGKFFADMWSNAVDSDDIFDESDNVQDDITNIINSPDKNGFVKVRYHWSEDPTKSEEWYTEQKRELNFDTRSINQELDLLFIGSTTCIFEDKFLAALRPKQPLRKKQLSYYSHLKLYGTINTNDYFIIGVDTAKSLTGDYCAIQIYDYYTFNQIGEFFNRLGSITKFSDIVKEVIDYVVDNSNGRVLVAIENNSIGSSIIENLENDNSKDYTQYLFVDPNQKDNFKYGITTSAKSKDQMVSIFYDYINESPALIHSTDLIEQLSVIEKKSNGSVSAKTGYHDDLFMASCFCAYAKKQTLLDPTFADINPNTSPNKNLELKDVIKEVIIGEKPTHPFDDIDIFSNERELLKTDDFDFLI